MLDLREMDELCCADCGRPLIATVVGPDPNKAAFYGCRCGHEVYNLPDCIVAGFSGGPFFFYVPKASHSL